MLENLDTNRYRNIVPLLLPIWKYKVSKMFLNKNSEVGHTPPDVKVYNTTTLNTQIIGTRIEHRLVV